MGYILLQDYFLVNVAESLDTFNQERIQNDYLAAPCGLYDGYFIKIGIYHNIPHSEPVLLVIYCFSETGKEHAGVTFFMVYSPPPSTQVM